MSRHFPRQSFLYGLLGVLAIACGDGSVGTLEVEIASRALCAKDTFESVPTSPGSRPSAPAETDGNLLHWHCGEVLGPSKVVAVYWGASWRGEGRHLVEGLTHFLQNFGGTPYADLVREYRGLDQSGAMLSASSDIQYDRRVFDDAPLPQGEVTDLDTGKEVCRLFDNAIESNTLYVVFSDRPPTGGACGRHKGKHYCTPESPVAVLTATIHNVAAVDYACALPEEVLGPADVGRLANVTAHELMETVTNPRLTGWFNDGGFSDENPTVQSIEENGDKCAGIFDHPVMLVDGSPFWLQAEWSNAAYRVDAGFSKQGCVLP